MSGSISIFKRVTLIILCLASSLTNAQRLIESRQTSYLTYIYKLTNEEARKIYSKDIWEVDSTYFHTMVDSFPTDSEYKGTLLPGHYLKTYSEKEKQKFFIMSVPEFDVFILNNNTDMCIQVYDLKGELISDANVSIRMKTLRFDSKTQSYTDKKSNKKGLLKVNHNGYTAYYRISRQHNNSLARRSTRKIVYGTPLKYIWMPVNYIIRVPVDAVKSVVRGYPQGTISRTRYVIRRIANKIAYLFDNSYYNSYGNSRFKNKHTGYIVFNKPKYLPGDTVKFKAFLVSKKGNPVNKTIDVILNTERKRIELTQLAPFREGAYEYQFLLHDSLGLQLDKTYYVYLQLNDGKNYINGSFRYEDYELTKTSLNLRTDQENHFKGKEFNLYVSGTDENDLNLLDARLEVLVKPKEVSEYFKSYVFIPDTLCFIKKELLPDDETLIIIPDSVFPPANLKYTIQVRLLTSDNESVTEKKDVEFFHLKREFEFSLQADSLVVTFNENGIPVSKNVTLSANDNFGNITPLPSATTPCKIVLNPYFRGYTAKTDTIEDGIEISSLSSGINCMSERTDDSIFIIVDNPHKIPFTYNIYKRNNEQARGYADSLKMIGRVSNKQNYFVSIRYLWGGKIIDENYRIPYADSKLNISVSQPRIIYPGQKTRIEILVTDNTGNPVQGVDLTAFSLTKKFGYTAPVVPDMAKERKNKAIINNFSFMKQSFDEHTGLKLDYTKWNILAGLDSIEYYKFIYPKNSIYRFEYSTEDHLTQFAPFVFSEGAAEPVHIIYCDGVPVYFSWSNNIQQYSFQIDSGFHQIKLRTREHIITLNKFYINYGKKLIFSLNNNLTQSNVSIEPVKADLTDYEKQLLHKYIFPYRNTFGEKFAYIETGNRIQFLKPSLDNFYSRNNMAGPVSGDVKFNIFEGYSTSFKHEPYFEYDFAPGLLKMRSVDQKMSYPQVIPYLNSDQELSDQVLTKDKLENQWEDYKNEKRLSTARYKYPGSTSSGKGMLHIDYTRRNKSSAAIPINILVFRYDNPQFLRVYPGSTSVIHQLDKGLHKLIFFFPDSKYFIADSLTIQTDGLNYCKIQEPLLLEKDAFSVEVSRLIEETIFKQVPYFEEEEKELRQIFNTYQQQFRYTGAGREVEGFVYDAKGGETLAGVNVLVMGTTYGAITDINGYFKLTVPSGKDVLNFSFIGYTPHEVNIGSNSVIDVRLQAEVLRLDEVVVIGYGVATKKSLSASVSAVVTSNIFGGIPGVSSNITQSLQGRVAGVQIVSDSTGNGAKVSISIRGMATTEFSGTPLYIINGSVFTGDISQLSPDLINNIEILKDERATAIYGAMGANGVVIITTKEGTFQPAGSRNTKGADYDNAFFEAATKSSSIREDFSDYAFWQPGLVSDREGKAGFDVTFPDDVTSWDTYYLAMNDKRQSGQASASIKSYKPLMAQLSVPRFLVTNDTTYAIGKVVNYTSDSIRVKTSFEVDGRNLYSDDRYCINSLIDTLLIKAESDSINAKYYLEKEDGYFDGEQKRIPVFPIGLEETMGKFMILGKDTTINLSFDPAFGPVKLYAREGLLDVIGDELSHLINYRYSCNEQLASKLKALLLQRTVAKFRGEEFKGEKEVNRLITQLQKNQKETGLWGWWKNSEPSYWITLHVMEALAKAGEAGFSVKLNNSQLSENLIWELKNTKSFSNSARTLRILMLLNLNINLTTYIKDLERQKSATLNEYLKLLELKQLNKMSCKTDTLKSYQKETLFGSIYFSDDKNNSDLLDNDIQNTILAYRILRSDTLTNPIILEKIRNYFLEVKRDGYWRNTYESAQIIETILPDLLGTRPALQKSKLIISGDVSKTVSEFPFQTEVDPASKITVSKTGDMPVYFTAYQHFWNAKPEVKNNDLIITSRFSNDSSLYLKAGQETKLIVDLEVKKDADFIMINIPIPGSCSYTEKGNNFKYEVHREYFKNETAIFCEKLIKGNYTFEVKLTPRYSGKYTLNPAKVELMYFPTFNANNEIKRVTVK